MKKSKKIDNQIVIYQTKTGAIEIKKDMKADTVWATQADVAKLFEKNQSVISRHIKNIFSEGEVDGKSNMQKMHIANSDKPVVFYSLDIILAVGYRTNSGRAIEFRQWATKTLKQYISEGYLINKNRIVSNYAQFQSAIENIKLLLPKSEQRIIDNESILELVNLFADTWLSLDAYDKDALTVKGATRKHIALTAEKLSASLAKLKSELIKKGEASEIFGNERAAGSVAGIVGNVMQAFGGQELYPTVEEKAAHLLYFMVKNHPFTDGNKRSGAYAFVWFLRQAKILEKSRITPPALTALTILVAESNPKNKEKMIKLILTILKRAK